MSERDQDFQAELENLLNIEQPRYEREKRSPFYLESLEQERLKVVEAYNDHVMAMSQLGDDVLSFEDFQEAQEMQNPQDIKDVNNTIANFVMKEIESHDVLWSGEMQFSGQVLFYENDGDEPHSGFLEHGQVLHGEVAGYEVTPTVLGDGETDDSELPGVWAYVRDALVVSVDGSEDAFTEAYVKINMPHVRMSKVVRRSQDETLAALDPEAELSPAALKELMAGPIFLEMCRDIENDFRNAMAYNEYNPEQITELRRSVQDQITALLENVPIDADFMITADEAMPLMHTEIEDIADKPAFYSGTTVVGLYGEYRVVHGFTLVEPSGEQRIVHVLPQNIRAISQVK